MPFPQRRNPLGQQGPDMEMRAPRGERPGPPLITDDYGLPEKGRFVDPSQIPPGDVGSEGPMQERAGVSPRDNPTLRGAGQATPSRPMSPTPMAGSTFSPMPFEPLPGAPPASLASPQRRGLYGSMGGLKGGGLGVPLDPVADETSDPISGLIKMLQQRMGR